MVASRICRQAWLLRTATACVLLCTVAALASKVSAQAAVTPDSDHVLSQAQIPLGNGSPLAPKYLYLFSSSARWKGVLHWKYNHANAPQPLAADKAGVIAQLQRSFDKWTSQCGLTYLYDGETTTPPNNLVTPQGVNPQPDGVSVVGWGQLDPTLGGWTYAWYVQNGSEREIFEADITLSVNNVASLPDVDRLMTHEWGHALGLDHSNTEAAIMAGPPHTQYNALVTPQSDDIRGCRCLYGLPPGVSAPYACSVPPTVDFGDAFVGEASPPQMVTFTNSGNAPLSFQNSAIDNAQFKHVAGCTPGSVVLPGESCKLQLQATPAAAGAIAAKLQLFTNDGFYELALNTTGVAGSSAGQGGSGAPTVEVVEYYNASLDHYFITHIAAEIANLDAGLTPTRWTRTGESFRAYLTPQSGTSPICRFYIPPADGNSHFFGRSAAECSASQQAHPEFVLEDPNYMQMALPVAGTCPTGTLPVYRVFDNRADTNHRYTTDRTIRDQMLTQGWVAEGDGPDLVVMCAPQ